MLVARAGDKALFVPEALRLYGQADVQAALVVPRIFEENHAAETAAVSRLFGHMPFQPGAAAQARGSSGTQLGVAMRSNRRWSSTRTARSPSNATMPVRASSAHPRLTDSAVSPR